MGRKMSVSDALEKAASLTDKERFCLDAWHFGGRDESMRYYCWEWSRDFSDAALARPEADRIAKCSKWFSSQPVKGYLQELERLDREKVAQMGLKELDSFGSAGELARRILG